MNELNQALGRSDLNVSDSFSLQLINRYLEKIKNNNGKTNNDFVQDVKIYDAIKVLSLDDINDLTKVTYDYTLPINTTDVAFIDVVVQANYDENNNEVYVIYSATEYIFDNSKDDGSLIVSRIYRFGDHVNANAYLTNKVINSAVFVKVEEDTDEDYQKYLDERLAAIKIAVKYYIA